MTSQVVLDIRARIQTETRPLSALERALLVASIYHHGVTPGSDPVAELVAAIAAARTSTATLPAGHPVRTLVDAAGEFADATDPANAPRPRRTADHAERAAAQLV